MIANNIKYPFIGGIIGAFIYLLILFIAFLNGLNVQTIKIEFGLTPLDDVILCEGSSIIENYSICRLFTLIISSLIYIILGACIGLLYSIIKLSRMKK